MKRLPVLLGMLLLTGVAGWLALKFDVSELFELSLPVTVGLVLVTVIFMLNHALGVSLILRGMGANVPYLRTYHVITGAAAASYLGNLQLSVPLRVFMLNRLLNVPVGIGVGAVGVEALLWIGMMGTIVALPVTAIWGSLAWLPSVVALLGCAGGALSLRYLPAVGKLIPDRLGRFPLRRLREFTTDLDQGIRLIKPRNLVLAGGCFAVNYSLDALSLYVLLNALGYSVNPVYLLYVIVLSYLAGALSMIPMGLGTRDISFIMMLTHLGPSPEVAATAALLQRVLRSLIPLLLSVISLNVLGVKHLGRQRLEEDATSAVGP